MKHLYLILFSTILFKGALYAQQSVKSVVQPDNYKAESFEIPEGKTEGVHYANKRIQFKLKNGHDNALQEGSPILTYLQSIGATWKTLFPMAKRPEREFDNFGRKYADLTRIYEADYTQAIPVKDVMKALKSFGITEYVQPNFFVEHEGEDKINFTPNDPQIASQWHLTKIQAYSAWDITQGDSTVIIGIPDGGSNLVHPDLLNIAFNYDDPIDGIDNDGDGWPDNLQGWNTGSNNHITQYDFGGGANHGVAVTGMASATVNNATNGAGVGFNCKYMPIKIVNASNQWSGAEPGVFYAAENGAKVINCSWGNTFPWPLVEDVIRYAAINKGCFIAASAGNNNNSAPFWPAAYELTTCVAGTNSSDIKSTNSSFYNMVDICAPGEGLFSTSNYTFGGIGSGTSFASPLVAGSAALIFSHFPTYTSEQAKALLKESSFNLYSIPANSSNIGKLGKGRLDIGNALNSTPGPSITMASRVWSDGADDILSPGDTLSLTGNFVNWLNPSTSALKCTLRCTSPFVTLVDSVVTIGAVNNLASFNNSSFPFQLAVGLGCPANTVLPISLNFKDGIYSDVQHISVILNPSYLNITENNLHTSITSNGRIGFADWNQQLGLGISKQGNMQHLRISSLIFSDSPTRVSDATLNATLTPSNNPVNNDFNTITNPYQINPPEFADFEAYSKFNDDNAGVNKLEIETTQKAYAWNSPGDENFVILEYTLKNTGVTALSNFYSGIYSYWIIPNAQFYYLQFAANWDSALRMGYAYNNDNPIGGFAGIKLLSYDSVSWYAFNNNGFNGSINLFDGFSDAEKHTALSNGVSRPFANPGTVSGLIGTGPLNIPAGETAKVAFALLIGDNLSELQQAAQAAQIKYDQFTATWTGAVSSDWNEPGNWFPLQVPNSCSTDIYIPLTANQPEISGTDIIVRNLRADDGTSILISNGNSISVCKNIMCGYTSDLTISGGELILSGTAAQTIDGKITADFVSLENIVNAEVITTGNLIINKGIELKSGELFTNSNLTLISNAGGTAYLNDFGTGFTGLLNGEIKVQRYNTGSSGFRQLGTPVQTSSISSVTGFSASGSPGFVIPIPSCNPDQIDPGSPYGNWMRLVENKPSVLFNCQQNLFEVLNSGGMSAGRGYYMNNSGNNLITFNGSPNTGTVTIPASHANPSVSNGWNMLANPYPSPLRWELIDVPSGFDAIAHLWVTSGSYTGTFQPLDPNLPGIQSLAIGQGFQLRVSTPFTTPNFIVSNANRTTLPPSFLLDAPESNALSIDITGNGFADVTKIRLMDNATETYDGVFDSYKMAGKSNQPMIYSVMDNQKMSINSLPFQNMETIIPLGLKTGASGIFTFTFTGADQFTENRLIYFEDAQEDIYKNVNAENSYLTELSSGEYENRFYIHILPEIMVQESDSYCDIPGSALLSANLPGNWNFELHDSQHQILQSGNYSNPLFIDGLTVGAYSLKLIEQASGYTLNLPIDIQGESPFLIEATASSELVQPNELIQFSAQVPVTSYMLWNFGDGNFSNELAPSHSFENAGLYTVTLEAQSEGCSSDDLILIMVNELNSINNSPHDSEEKIQIWNNAEELYLLFKESHSGITYIRLIDAYGKHVMEKQLQSSEGLVKMNLSHLSSGFYTLVLKHNKTEIKRKLIVARL